MEARRETTKEKVTGFIIFCAICAAVVLFDYLVSH